MPRDKCAKIVGGRIRRTERSYRARAAHLAARAPPERADNNPHVHTCGQDERTTRERTARVLRCGRGLAGWNPCGARTLMHPARVPAHVITHTHEMRTAPAPHAALTHITPHGAHSTLAGSHISIRISTPSPHHTLACTVTQPHIGICRVCGRGGTHHRRDFWTHVDCTVATHTRSPTASKGTRTHMSLQRHTHVAQRLPPGIHPRPSHRARRHAACAATPWRSRVRRPPISARRRPPRRAGHDGERTRPVAARERVLSRGAGRRRGARSRARALKSADRRGRRAASSRRRLR
jgi:hypothetical protein